MGVINRSAPFTPDKTRQEAALALLNPLVGMWNLKLSIRTQPRTILWGMWSIFEWLEGKQFLTWRWGPSQPEFPGGALPSALSVIGYDDSTRLYFVHYYDSRGVYRLLDMEVEGRAWKVWRISHNFSQRFTASISEDGKIMNGSWEKSSDRIHWNHDFDMTFTKEA